MSHYAYVENGFVTRVIVIEQDVIDTGLHGDPAKFVQCSYNTHGGVHSLGGAPLRKNYPGVGFIYDLARDAFYAPQPYPSWVLEDATCLWNAPVPMPTDGARYMWDEVALAWVAM